MVWLSHMYIMHIMQESTEAVLLQGEIDLYLGLPCFVLSFFLLVFSLQSWIFRKKVFMAVNEYSAQSLLRKLGERRELDSH